MPPYEDKIALGGWYYTTSLPDLSERNAGGAPVMHRGSGGFYALADARLFTMRGAHINGFVQAGLGDARVDRVGSYVGLGLVAAGAIPDRPNDQLGFALAIAGNGSHFRKESPGQSEAETALELTYACQLADWLSAQPDLQYVWHPGSVPGLHDALIVQLELETSF